MTFSRRHAALTAALGFFVSSSTLALGSPGQPGSAATTSAPAKSKQPGPPSPNLVVIPGPLRSFLRMAGISQKISTETVIPQLTKNLYTLGYQHGQSTEYLVLLNRYVHQARELQAMAQNQEIRVEHCQDAAPLLQVLGYRMHGNCGDKGLALMTNDPERAFVTIDSGFPLTRLEQALATDTPFTYPYSSSRAPILFRQSDWTNLAGGKKRGQDMLDVLLHDPQVARLYWAFSKMDPETAAALQRSASLWSLLPYGNVLDFYGAQLFIRSKRVQVPGGKSADEAWASLVGASPGSPGEFVTHLVGRDRGWLAAYYDSLARVSESQQAHFTQGTRLSSLYEAFHEADPDADAGGASFRKAPELLVLFTRQEWMPNGEPRIPGTIEMWKQILDQKTDFKTVHDWAKKSRHWNNPEQLLEAMVAFSRLDTDYGPLQVYLTFNEIQSSRSRQNGLSPQTMLLMASNYAQFSGWYTTFAEFPELNDDSVSRFIKVANTLDHISNQELRGNALGTYQANLGLWQILARQGEIPASEINASWQNVISPFEKINSSPQLFDAGFKSLGQLMLASTGSATQSQEQLIQLLAGPAQRTSEAQKIRSDMAARIRSVEDDQRLISLDTLLELSNGLKAMEHGAHPDKRLLDLAGELREFEMPRPIFTESEKDQWAPGVLNDRHAELQIRTDVAKAIEQQGAPSKLETVRGQLVPFLRDTLVGFNYAYYEPPGSRILHINPLFVRSHDFAGQTVVGEEHIWQPSTLFGVGAPAGGGAYLVGSLADLPYVLAAAEQDFIAPENVQALIWQELVPALLSDATVSRWWNVSPHELHAVALYQVAGEELLTAGADNQQIRERVIAILSDHLPSQRLGEVEQALQSKNVQDQLSRLAPSDTFYLAVEYRDRYPQDFGGTGPAADSIEKLSREYPSEVSLERISKDFGTPHPVLAQSYGRQLMNVKPFPAFSGTASRLFGESWHSNNLYWARLIDERGELPVQLNVLSPQLTRVMISKIFASNTEDWPAIVRAMHEAGNEYLQGSLAPQAPTQTTAQR